MKTPLARLSPIRSKVRLNKARRTNSNFRVGKFFGIFLCIFLCGIFLSSLLPSAASAQQNQDLVNQQDWITRQQQNKLEEEKRDRDFDAMKKERERRKKEQGELKNQQSDSGAPAKAPQCFAINEIELIDATLISKSQQQKLLQPFIGKCFDGQKISELIASVTNFYHSKGYISTQVAMPKQAIHDGTLELKITEGKIEKIAVITNNREDRFTDKMREFTAFGNREGDILDLNDINQGIYQMNRLSSNRAVMKIEPGSDVGESKVAIENQKKFPARATIGYDNLGNNFTGVRRSNFSGNLDDLFFLNDSLSLTYNTNLNDDNQKKDIKSFSSSFAIPFRYYTFSFDYSKSDFVGLNAGVNGPTKLTGFSDRKSFTVDRLLLNEGNLRLSSAASLTTKESASYFNYSKLSNSERKHTIANFSLALSSSFENGASLYLKPSYSKGLKLLNANQDQANLKSTEAKAQFDVFKLYASLSKRFIVPKLNVPLTFSTEMDSQFAKQTLFGSEQFSVGGNYSVRGFRENYINGDNGYYFRNKFNVNLGSLIAPLLAPGNDKENQNIVSQNFFRRNLVHLNKFSFEPFYDYGHVKNKYADNGASGRLSGAGIKTIFNSKFFNASLTYAKSMSQSQLITSTTKEDRLVYFEISASCC